MWDDVKAFSLNVNVTNVPFHPFVEVAPVVPDLDSDIDTTNFDEIADPEGGEETFAVTKVTTNYFQLLLPVVYRINYISCSLVWFAGLCLKS